MRPSLRLGWDPFLVLPVLALVCIGAFMVYSASLVVAYNFRNDDTYFLQRQVLWCGLGLLGMLFIGRIDYRHWRRFSLPALILTSLLLIAVLVPGIGSSAGGSSRWLKAGPLQIQPSELIKLVLVLYMADWLAIKGPRVGNFLHSSLPFLIMLGVVCGLVVVEPDFGTTVIIALTAISVFWVAGANILQFIGGMILVSGLGWIVMIKEPYRFQRVWIWIDPWQDRLGAGWHTIQTLIAMGSGGLFGRGLGSGLQKHSWLDNPHTDAIFAVLGEELGFVGTAAVVALYTVLIGRGLIIAYRIEDPFSRLLAAGLTAAIFWQAAINIAVVTNSSPYTGVPLPFISFGGSSLLVSLAEVGLLLSIERFGARSVTPSGAPVEDSPQKPAAGKVRRRVRSSLDRNERENRVPIPLRAPRPEPSPRTELGLVDR